MPRTEKRIFYTCSSDHHICGNAYSNSSSCGLSRLQAYRVSDIGGISRSIQRSLTKVLIPS